MEEVQITLFADGSEFKQLAPLESIDRRPKCASLNLKSNNLEELKSQYQKWVNDITNSTERHNLTAKLKEIGGKVLAGDLSKLFPLRDGVERIRALVYTDAQATSIPVEAAFNDTIWCQGCPREFLITWAKPRISFVRHLGLAPLEPLPIGWGAPLRMLVVFSNLSAETSRLGQFSFDAQNGRIVFLKVDPSRWLYHESKTLEDTLGDLCRLGLLHVRFLIGDEGNEQGEGMIYEGDLVPGSADHEFTWRTHRRTSGALKDHIIEELRQAETLKKPYHILHYYGHGVVEGDGAKLLTKPGPNMSPNDLGSLSRTPRIVFLAACHTAESQLAPPGELLTGFASALLFGGTAVLVSMITAVTPLMATATTRYFYKRLIGSLFMNPLDAEDALHDLRYDRLLRDQQPDFFVPVLYMRPILGQGRLFSYRDPRVQMWKQYQDGRICLNPVTLAVTAWLWLKRKQLLPSGATKPKKVFSQSSSGSSGSMPG